MDAAGAVEHIGEGVAFLAGVDPDTLTAAEIHEHLVAIVRVRPQLDAAAAHFAARWDANQTWSDDGSKSAAARLAREGHCARRTTAAILKRGRALREMPVTDAAYTAGQLSSDHVDLLTSCTARQRAELFRDHEPTVVGEAKQLGYDQAAKLVAYWKHHADEALGDDGDEPDHSARAKVGTRRR